MSYAVAELDRRMAAMMMVGTIEEVDHANARCRVRVGDWVSAMLPWASLGAGQVRSWRPPSKGEQAMIMSPSGDPAGGFVLPGFYTDQHQQANDNRGNVTAQNYPDGAREHYDHEAHEHVLNVPAGGRIVLQIGGTTLELTSEGSTLKTPKLLVDAPESTFTGKVQVQGLLSYMAGMVGQGGSGGATAAIEGTVRISSGNLNVNGGDVTADGISLKSHVHMEQGDGAATSSAK